jgi:hypothetical protein
MATTWDPDDMEKVAFHEAGHAVVAWLFGLPLKRIYLDLKTEGGGVAPDLERAACLCLAQLVAVQYGGPISEKMFRSPGNQWTERRAAFDRPPGHRPARQERRLTRQPRRARSPRQGLFLGRKIVAQARIQGCAGCQAFVAPAAQNEPRTFQATDAGRLNRLGASADASSAPRAN